MAELPPIASANLCPIRELNPQRHSITWRDGSHLVEWLDNFPEHDINNALYWAACRADDIGVLDRIEDDLVNRAVYWASPNARPAGRWSPRRTEGWLVSDERPQRARADRPRGHR